MKPMIMKSITREPGPPEFNAEPEPTKRPAPMEPPGHLLEMELEHATVEVTNGDHLHVSPFEISLQVIGLASLDVMSLSDWAGIRAIARLLFVDTHIDGYMKREPALEVRRKGMSCWSNTELACSPGGGEEILCRFRLALYRFHLLSSARLWDAFLASRAREYSPLVFLETG